MDEAGFQLTPQSSLSLFLSFFLFQCLVAGQAISIDWSLPKIKLGEIQTFFKEETARRRRTWKYIYKYMCTDISTCHIRPVIRTPESSREGGGGRRKKFCLLYTHILSSSLMPSTSFHQNSATFRHFLVRIYIYIYIYSFYHLSSKFFSSFHRFETFQFRHCLMRIWSCKHVWSFEIYLALQHNDKRLASVNTRKGVADVVAIYIHKNWWHLFTFYLGGFGNKEGTEN